jgi:hypothetical protein
MYGGGGIRGIGGTFRREGRAPGTPALGGGGGSPYGKADGTGVPEIHAGALFGGGRAGGKTEVACGWDDAALAFTDDGTGTLGIGIELEGWFAPGKPCPLVTPRSLSAKSSASLE